MDNRPGGQAPRLSQISLPQFRFHFLLMAFACTCALLSTGCASPGEPTERKPPVPQAVADLAAQQVGNSVSLTFTVPQETADRHPLGQPPSVEIYRDFATVYRSAVQPEMLRAVEPAALLVTIPAAMVPNYVSQGRFHYADELRSQDFSGHSGDYAVYAVRTRVSAKRASAPSNHAEIRIYPVPEPIGDLKAELTHLGTELTWTQPTKTPLGPAPPIVSYRVYRAIGPTASSQQPSSQSRPAAPLEKIAETGVPDYVDSQTQFGSTYTYSVRSVVEIAELNGQQIESGDSNQVTILARDVFPPAAPQGLVVVYVPAQGTEPAHLELSWSISPETDLAGYNVYRSEQAAVQETRLNADLLPTPAFRDMNTAPGHAYFYTVTAVDRSGNESPASSAVSGGVPAENP